MNILGFGSLIKQGLNLTPERLGPARKTNPNEKSVRERARPRGVPKVRRKGGGERRSDCNLGSASVAKSSVEHCGGRKFLPSLFKRASKGIFATITWWVAEACGMGVGASGAQE